MSDNEAPGSPQRRFSRPSGTRHQTDRTTRARAFSRLAEKLTALDDDDLATFGVRLKDLVVAENDRLEWEHPLVQALAHVANLATEETNHRQATLWNVRAELQGGHHVVVVDDLEEVGTFQACCWPVWDDDKNVECWIGPLRATEEEAIEDARNHLPKGGDA